jgi:hypothetical protein
MVEQQNYHFVKNLAFSPLHASMEDSHCKELSELSDECVSQYLQAICGRPCSTRFSLATLHPPPHISEYLDDLLEECTDSCRRVFANCEFSISGSLWKHTFAFGVSDIDVLCAFNSRELSPNHVVSRLASAFSSTRTPIIAHQTHVTLPSPFGVTIDIVPVVVDSGEIALIHSSGGRWVRARPELFATVLQQANLSSQNTLKPSIRVLKSLLSRCSSAPLLKGHHIEAICVHAASEFAGTFKITTLLEFILSQLPRLANLHFVDTSGQLQFIDDYLGASDSDERCRLSAYLTDYRARMADTHFLRSAAGKFGTTNSNKESSNE